MVTHMLVYLSTNLLTRPLIILYCGYMSFKAIESTNKDDDTQWLTFWLLYSIIVFAEIWTDIFLAWYVEVRAGYGRMCVLCMLFRIPFYSELKIGLIAYLGIFKV